MRDVHFRNHKSSNFNFFLSKYRIKFPRVKIAKVFQVNRVSGSLCIFVNCSIIQKSKLSEQLVSRLSLIIEILLHTFPFIFIYLSGFYIASKKWCPSVRSKNIFNIKIVSFLTFVVNYFSRASQYGGGTRANDGKLDGQLIQRERGIGENKLSRAFARSRPSRSI